ELPPLAEEDELAESESGSEADSRGLWDSSSTQQAGGRVPSWRRVSDALRAEQDDAGALRELAATMAGFESTGDLVSAGAVIDEMIGIEPQNVERHRQRVELAFRGDDRVRLRLAYEGLASALDGAGAASEAATVRSRIAELDSAARGHMPAPARPQPAQVPQQQTRSNGSSDGLAEFVNLGDLLRADEPERTTRMVVEEQAPSGDEQADFAEMLAKFRQGLEENVDADDFESHHDLGVAFREMGLLDEAIVRSEEHTSELQSRENLVCR